MILLNGCSSQQPEALKSVPWPPRAGMPRPVLGLIVSGDGLSKDVNRAAISTAYSETGLFGDITSDRTADLTIHVRVERTDTAPLTSSFSFVLSLLTFFTVPTYVPNSITMTTTIFHNDEKVGEIQKQGDTDGWIWLLGGDSDHRPRDEPLIVRLTRETITQALAAGWL